MDGYDKLKPYGFPIHACIDGYIFTCYSLSASYMHANASLDFPGRSYGLSYLLPITDPGVVAQYYLTAVFQLGGRFVVDIVVVSIPNFY